MKPLPLNFSITRGATDEIDAYIEIDLAAGTMFAPTGLIRQAALVDHVPGTIFAAALIEKTLFVARESHGRPVGFAMASQRDDDLYLDQISVDPEFGRLRIGSHLLTRIIQEGRDRKARGILLSTFRDLAWNGPFYAKFGFRELPEKRKTEWMQEIEAAQAIDMNVDLRCFMRKNLRPWYQLF